MKRAMVVVVLGLVLTSCGGPTAIEDAVSACNDQLNVSLTAGDGGKSVSVSGGDFDLPAAQDQADLATQVSLCILDELKVPDAVFAKVKDTTAMMGRQSDSWGDYKLSWTYHPDNGLEIVVES